MYTFLKHIAHALSSWRIVSYFRAKEVKFARLLFPIYSTLPKRTVLCVCHVKYAGFTDTKQAISAILDLNVLGADYSSL